VTVEGFTDN
jgi:hypothetical protein